MKLIPLTQGLFAMVDDFDYKWLKKIKWYAKKSNNKFYAVNGSPKIYMHRLLLGLSQDDKRMPDHIDRNSLNNQRSNLRIATHKQNCHNSPSRKDSLSLFKGVTWDKGKKRWKARIGSKHLGHFKIETDAAAAYNNTAKELHGEFACLNTILLPPACND